MAPRAISTTCGVKTLSRFAGSAADAPLREKIQAKRARQ